MYRLTQLFVALAIIVCGFLPTESRAQTYPAKPIVIVVPFAVGGAADVTVRLVAQKLGERMGQAFVVENKPSAGGIVAAQSVAQAKPDGHTLLLVSNGSAVSVSLFKSLPFDPVKDFAPVSTLGFFSLAIVARNESSLTSLKDFVAAAKSASANFNVATINIGSTQHLAAELFKSTAGLEFTVVPYKSSPDVVRALEANDVQVAFEILSPLMPHIKSGKLKPLAVTSERRFAGLPNVPTVMESGFPSYSVSSWNGIAAPASTPRAIIERLNSEIKAVVAMPDVKQKLLELGVEARAGSPEALKQLLASEIEKWKAVVERAKIEKQ